MHHPTETINTPINSAPRFSITENVARKETISEDILAIQAGTATLAVAYEWAFKFMSLASQKVGSINLGDLDHMDREQARAALDEIETGRDHLRGIAPLFEKYPYIVETMRFHCSALFYAEATLIPFYIQCNKSFLDQKVSSTKTYIVRHPITGMIKIGRTSDVQGRIKSLQTGAGAILATLAIIPADIEQELHKRFAALRRHGEWFEDVDGLISSCANTQEAV
ncbi:GIY-YIG nuclease family protein [Pseudomonas sp. ChxA]|uniref:GIY-YIG nuclease family protein n=1 Tax=Pseudomonas sp. ChxA TaxID=3035473 RepID=UPI002555C77B|nr:GIY-YIG nuclease family protein [Pseudomonas sp. ChxA]MDL2186742.1 GIY-YIG nuclease family protein [Pseudomonas sp. ChxA]